MVYEMNNRGMMTTLLTVGAAGAAIYGIKKGMESGTLQKLPQTFSKAANNQNVQQMTKAATNLMDNQDGQQQLTNALQQMGSNNQTTQ